MTQRISTRPRSGVFSGRTVFTNRQGQGIFTGRADGTHQQHTGTGQTPVFRSVRHLATWLRRHYSDDVQSGRATAAK